jgi:glutathione S-transferase
LLVKLYYSPGASSLAPHIACREAGLDVELVRVDLEAQTIARTGEVFLAVNPMGKVPALATGDGRVLTEGAAVLQYVADLAPASGLMPAAGTWAHYRVLEILNFVATELHKGFAPMFDPELPDAWRARLLSDPRPILRMAALVDAGSYLLGETFTVADAYFFVILRLGRNAGLDFSPWPAVGAYMERVAARPAVRQAMQIEGLVDP